MKKQTKTKFNINITEQMYKRASLAIVALITVSFGGYFAVASALTEDTAQTVPTEQTITDGIATQTNTKKIDQTQTAVADQAKASKQAAANVQTQAAAKQATPTASITTNISKGTALYASAEQAAIVKGSASGSANDSAVLNRLASQATARWFGDWNTDVRGAVNHYVSAARSAGQVPVTVAYNIPGRDCGGESAGGVSSSTAYASWVREFAAGVGNRPAIVILEPDAIAADCFNDSRGAMLSDAASVMQAAGASVYMDGGNPTWRSASNMADRLKRAGIANASGFALNVSNYQTTGSNISYGNSVSSQVGGKRYVIDTSRNGNGPSSNYEWCNASGRALGNAPTTATGQSLVDAYLWIKVPGESDGRCGAPINGTQPPAAGIFWPEYALMLARNAGW